MRKVIVYHRGYGCDTGCCGHSVLVLETAEELAALERYGGKDVGYYVDAPEKFDFSHAYRDDPREYAERLVRAAYGDDHVADLDWDNCYVTDNC